MLDASQYDFTIEGYLAWLASLAGLSAQREPDDYKDLAAKCGPESARSFLAGVTPPGAPNSGCMVAQCGAVENFFASHSKPSPLIAPVGYDRWVVMTTWAALQGALIAPGQWQPTAGDIVLLFTPPNHQHWVGLLSSNALTETIEGGQLDGSYQCVQQKQRYFTKTDKWREVYSSHDVVQIVRIRTLIEKA